MCPKSEIISSENEWTSSGPFANANSVLLIPFVAFFVANCFDEGGQGPQELEAATVGMSAPYQILLIGPHWLPTELVTGTTAIFRLCHPRPWLASWQIFALP